MLQEASVGNQPKSLVLIMQFCLVYRGKTAMPLRGDVRRGKIYLEGRS